MTDDPRRREWNRSFLKRLVDVIAASLGLVLSSPIIAICAALVAVTSPGGVLYRQQRAGRDGRVFAVLKFRTMRPTTGDWDPSTDADRLTKVGVLLRRSSLDELPQLWNVLVGEMSLVGPRPLPVVYVARYSAEQRRRLEVRPGLTGLAQVRGRNALTWPEKFRWDVEYVDTATPWLDVRIVALTVLRLFSGGGVSAGGHATMPEFTGEEA